MTIMPLTYIAMEQIACLHIVGSMVGLIVLLWTIIRMSSWLRPHSTYVAKRTTYESGSEPTGYAQGPTNSRLHIIGLIFLIFEVETILLVPWALAWVEKDMEQHLNSSSSLHMAILGTFFILVLGLGLIYFLSKWKNIGTNNTPIQHQLTNPMDLVPSMYYEKINAQYAGPFYTSTSITQKSIRK